MSISVEVYKGFSLTPRFRQVYTGFYNVIVLNTDLIDTLVVCVCRLKLTVLTLTEQM